jgi:anaerobic dimethyl sulfoxide reductase subunit B
VAKQYGFWIESKRCIKCWACVVACKSWKGIPAGTVTFRRVLDTWTGTFPNVGRTFVSLSCGQCEKPACVGVCPTSAISKRAADGIVLVDQSKCIGCHACLNACPFGVPQFDGSGAMTKCDYCVDRVPDGKQPACVATCPTQALHGGTMEELSKAAAGKAGERLAGSTVPSVLISR